MKMMRHTLQQGSFDARGRRRACKIRQKVLAVRGPAPLPACKAPLKQDMQHGFAVRGLVLHVPLGTGRREPPQRRRVEATEPLNHDHNGDVWKYLEDGGEGRGKYHGVHLKECNPPHLLHVMRRG